MIRLFIYTALFAVSTLSSAQSRIEEILSYDLFVNRFFNVCDRDIMSYVTRNISTRKSLIHVLELSTDRKFSFILDDITKYSSIEFAEDCSHLKMTLKTSETKPIFLPFQRKTKNAASPAIPAKIYSSALGENKIGISGNEQVFFPFEKIVGRFKILKSTAKGIYFHHESLLETSIRYYSPFTNSLKTIARFQPKADASIIRVPLEVGKSHPLPSYVVQTKASKGIVLYLHGGGCWMKNSHVEAFRFSPEALDIALAGYDLFLMSYSGDSDGQTEIPRVTNCGVDEIIDVVLAISFLKFKMGYENIYVLGESYGAYLLNLFLGRFPQVPINGAISKFGVWDLERQNAMIQSPAFLKITPNEINNPKHFVKEIKAPILLLHGEYDSQVAVSNATFFRDEAKKYSLNAEVLIMEHGLTHGFDYGGMADLDAKLKWHSRLIYFLESNLKMSKD